MAPWNGPNNDSKKGKEEEKNGIDIHPMCGPLRLFCGGCTYAKRLEGGMSWWPFS